MESKIHSSRNEPYSSAGRSVMLQKLSTPYKNDVFGDSYCFKLVDESDRAREHRHTGFSRNSSLRSSRSLRTLFLDDVVPMAVLVLLGTLSFFLSLALFSVRFLPT
jgi:hypothetical protein